MLFKWFRDVTRGLKNSNWKTKEIGPNWNQKCKIVEPFYTTRVVFRTKNWMSKLWWRTILMTDDRKLNLAADFDSTSCRKFGIHQLNIEILLVTQVRSLPAEKWAGFSRALCDPPLKGCAHQAWHIPFQLARAPWTCIIDPIYSSVIITVQCMHFKAADDFVW